MSRTSEYDADQILTAAGRLIAASGPGGATIGAIARAVGAPTGSIYHRFPSRDVLLAQVWLRAATAFQAEFFRRLAGAPPRRAGLAAALSWRNGCARSPARPGCSSSTAVRISSIGGGRRNSVGRLEPSAVRSTTPWGTSAGA